MEAREPTKTSEVVSNSRRFIPKLQKRHWSDKTGPEQRKAFKALNEELAKAGTLVYFHKDVPSQEIVNVLSAGNHTSPKTEWSARSEIDWPSALPGDFLVGLICAPCRQSTLRDKQREI